MSGRIIHFRYFRRFTPPPVGLSESRRDGALKRSPRGLGSGSSKKRTLRLQVTRIRRLLDELEALSVAGEGHEPAIVGQSRAAMESARALLLGSGESDPQPDVDGDMLERMYHELSGDD